MRWASCFSHLPAYWGGGSAVSLDRGGGRGSALNSTSAFADSTPHPDPLPVTNGGREKEGYRIAFAVSTNPALAVDVANTTPSSAINLPSMKAIILPICVTVASPTSGPTFAGARKLTVMVMVAV